jgi:hypothetical protein
LEREGEEEECWGRGKRVRVFILIRVNSSSVHIEQMQTNNRLIPIQRRKRETKTQKRLDLV